MGSLLTLAAAALPLVCPAKELAVLVLLPVSASRVVLGGGICTGGAEGVLGVPGVAGVVGACEPPQAARTIVRQSNARTVVG